MHLDAASPLISPPDGSDFFDGGGEYGDLVVEWSGGRIVSDIRSGVYQLPPTYYARASVRRFNPGAGALAVGPRVSLELQPGYVPLGSEWVRTGRAAVTAGGQSKEWKSTQRDGPYRYAQIHIDADDVATNSARSFVATCGKIWVTKDYSLDLSFPSYPRIDIGPDDDIVVVDTSGTFDSYAFIVQTFA